MMGETTRIRPQTLALDALVRATIDRVDGKPGTAHADTLLFLGNQHAAFPTLVVRDPVLEPVDKLVWMVISLQASEMDGNTAFPTYEYIAKTVNVSSAATVSRAIAILRVTRWLSLCARLRDGNGKFRGNVHALHDEPLPLADALHLDSDYMQFLRESTEHHHARVRAVANGVLDTLDEDIEAGVDVCANEHPVNRRMQAVAAVKSETPQRYFAFSPTVMAKLSNHSSASKGVDHQHQNLKTEDDSPQILSPQNLKTVCCSSSKLTTTTTTQTPERSNFVITGAGEAALIYPGRLSDNQRELADRYLSSVPPDQRQAILDELEGRIQSERKGMNLLYDEMRFMYSLCKALKNGEFRSNLGIKVYEDRLARERVRQQQALAIAQRQQCIDPGSEVIHKRMEVRKRSLAEIKKTLGKRSQSRQENSTGDA